MLTMAAGANSASQIAKATSSPGASTVSSSVVQTQVVARAVTNLHFVPHMGHIRLVTTNYSTNITVRVLPQVRLLRPQFFQRWY
jgi:hypothetical protein